MSLVKPFRARCPRCGPRAAVIMGESATAVSFGDIEERSRRYAHLLLRAAGLRPGRPRGHPDGEPRALLRGLLGRPTDRAVDHPDQLAPQGRRSRLHHRGLRRDRGRHLARLARRRGVARAVPRPRASAPDGRRHGAGLVDRTRRRSASIRPNRSSTRSRGRGCSTRRARRAGRRGSSPGSRPSRSGRPEARWCR